MHVGCSGGVPLLLAITYRTEIEQLCQYSHTGSNDVNRDTAASTEQYKAPAEICRLRTDLLADSNQFKNP